MQPAITQKMAARHGQFTLREKQAAVRVAEETKNSEAARAVLIVSNIEGQHKIIYNWGPLISRV